MPKLTILKRDCEFCSPDFDPDCRVCREEKKP